MKHIDEILIGPTSTIRHALERINETAGRIMFVVNATREIRGAVTDGDIRRWILKGGALNEPVARVMHRRPIVLREGYTIASARKLMVDKSIECLPVVDRQRRVLAAVWWVDLFEKKEPAPLKRENVPVVIMAGGEGHRLAPFTKVLPKPLVPIGDVPIVERILARFFEYGSRDFYLSVHYKSRIIKAFFQDNGDLAKYRVRFLEESKPLGTAGSLSLVRGRLKRTFWVTNCDIIIDADFSDILRMHRTNHNDLTLVGSLKHFTVPYGVCHLAAGGRLKSITEKPEYDYLVNTGVYLVEPSVLKHIPRHKMFHFTDLIHACIKDRGKVGVYPVSEKSWMDMGQLEELKDMSRRFGVEM